MSREIEVKTFRSPMTSDVTVAATFNDMATNEIQRGIFHLIAEKIAERYVAENYQEIVAQIDQQALATLSVAEGAAKIRESLEKNIPREVRTIVDRQVEVYQRGVLGGVKRVL